MIAAEIIFYNVIINYNAMHSQLLSFVAHSALNWISLSLPHGHKTASSDTIWKVLSTICVYVTVFLQFWKNEKCIISVTGDSSQIQPCHEGGV